MKKLLAVLAVVVCASVMTGCVTGTTLGGAGGPHGLIGGFGASGPVTEGASEVSSYTVWLGLFDAGFGDYASAVKQAEADGKVVSSKTTFYYFFTKTTAYAK